MTKTAAATAEASQEASVASPIAPMQESLSRVHKASEKLSATLTDIAAEQSVFLHKGLFDILFEWQGLSRARNPAEFIEVSTEFAWRQAERSLQAFSELGTEVCSCWLDAFKAAGELPATTMKSRARH